MLWNKLQDPRSSKVVAEDTDNALFTVTLFRRVADTFKTAARTRGFQVFTLHLPYQQCTATQWCSIGAAIVSSKRALHACALSCNDSSSMNTPCHDSP